MINLVNHFYSDKFRDWFREIFGDSLILATIIVRKLVHEWLSHFNNDKWQFPVSLLSYIFKKCYSMSCTSITDFQCHRCFTNNRFKANNHDAQEFHHRQDILVVSEIMSREISSKLFSPWASQWRLPLPMWALDSGGCQTALIKSVKELKRNFN